MAASNEKPLLILDLDETLIHGSQRELHRVADFRIGPLHIYERPLLNQFLNSASERFDLAIWSSASEAYVCQIAARLRKQVSEWEFVWSRERCIPKRNHETLEIDFLKDLRKVKRKGFDLDGVLIVDDTRQKVSRNYGNAIYIAPYFGSDDDVELSLLAGYLNSLDLAENFRRLEKRGWRSQGAIRCPNHHST